ncbi:hypothetical protein I5R92_10465 [Pseudomonas carnis]|uniref:hypothetical protein n=1 Tax=Pseudomonas carnis TaxID=2487355 RepID=UPI0018D9E444|nr:hypothetical protein [Pseudomonas carnis]MBH3367707.1 hypothetical protein [Pseudomonas carnis]MDE1533063.1 hypothetical protein [Pseudomonas carnis]
MNIKRQTGIATLWVIATLTTTSCTAPSNSTAQPTGTLRVENQMAGEYTLVVIHGFEQHRITKGESKDLMIDGKEVILSRLNSQGTIAQIALSAHSESKCPVTQCLLVR